MNIDPHIDEVFALQQELLRHPELMEKCKETKSFSELMGTIAADVGIALDGAYTYNDTINLCRVLKDKLESKRSPIIY